MSILPLEPAPTHVFLFSGHTIDHPERATPRFPATKAMQARNTIEEILANELREIHQAVSNGTPQHVIGIAGGASGGDIIFHEACYALHIPTYLFLLFPRDQFIATSVAQGGRPWVERFNTLYMHSLQHQRVITPDIQTPASFNNDQHISVWGRNNTWMLENALTWDASRLTCVFLWDGKDSGLPGGTSDMVDQAQALGAKTIVIDTKTI